VPAPLGVHLLLVLLAAMAAGFLWGLIPGVLKAYLSVDEVVSTLMLNVIAAQIFNLFLIQWMRDPTVGYIGTVAFPETAVMPLILPSTRVTVALVIALLAVAAVIAPSRHEAWGMTVFEALALGIPVLAARTGGLPHLCAQAPHARLFTPLSLPALSDGLQMILAPDFPRGPDLGLAYRSQPAFDPARRSDQWLTLYQHLLP